MEVTVDNIEKAVHDFYGGGIGSGQKEIHSWLMQLQSSQQAWQFCWQLLSKDKSLDVQFFGASCLYFKISKSWHEVPSDQVEALRAQLFEQIASFAAGPKMVTTRLCVALAALALHTMSDEWPDAVSDIMATFQHSNLRHIPEDQVVLLLLELLTVLPEEFYTSPMTQREKAGVRPVLHKSHLIVLQFLQTLMSLEPGASTTVQEQCLRCLSSWIQNISIHLIDIESLIPHIFPMLQQHNFFETAIDTLINVFCNEDNHRYPSCLERLLNKILQLLPMLTQAQRDSDMETCQGLTKLIVTAVEQNSQQLLRWTTSDEAPKGHLAASLVNMALQCTAMPGHYPVDESCSDMPFGFWYIFQDDIISSERVNYLTLHAVYLPVYTTLVDILLQKAQYPADSEYQSWNADEKESHRCYRQDIADTLMYTYNLVNDTMLCKLCATLGAALQRATASANQVCWQELEALLFAVTSVAESVSIDEERYLPQIFSLLASIPCSHFRLISQALYLIGSYAEWISGHPQVLGNVIPLLLQGLRDTELAQPASLSLKEVVRENQEHLSPYVNHMLQAIKEAIDSGILKSKETVRLMGCLGHILSILPTADVIVYLNHLLAPHIHHLQQLASSEPTAAAKSQIQLRLNMLCWLFGSLGSSESKDKDETQRAPNDPHPVLLVLEDVFPVLQAILQRWIGDPGVVEDFCDMLRRALRSLMNHFAPLVGGLTELIQHMYTAVPHPVLLDLAKQVVVLFASEDQYKESCHRLFTALCSKTLVVIQTDGVREQTELMEVFMGFLSQMAKKCKFLFLDGGCNVLGLYEAAVLGLSVPETHTIKASCLFLSDLISACESNPQVKQVLLSHGQLAVQGALRVIGGDSPRPAVDHTADLFLAFNKHMLPQLCVWLHEVVQQVGFPKPWATQEQKEHFARQIIMERVNKRKLKETVNEYTLVWRGMVGTEYAAQTFNPLG